MILTNYQISIRATIANEPEQKYNDGKSMYKSWGIEGGTRYNWEDKKILIIDTDKVNCELLRMLLRSTRAHSFILNDPVRLVKYDHKQGYYDLIIMEIYLKGAYGIDILRNIRLYDNKVPIIIYSVISLEETIKECHELGCNDYLVKPSNLWKLLEVCNRVIHY